MSPWKPVNKETLGHRDFVWTVWIVRRNVNKQIDRPKE